MDDRELGLLACAYIWAFMRWLVLLLRASLQTGQRGGLLSLVQEIITKLYLVEACAQNHTLEASNFAWKNHSS